jgi:capsular polysaccharide biosynthesis protein
MTKCKTRHPEPNEPASQRSGKMRYNDFVESISRVASSFENEAAPSPTGCRYFDYSAGQPNLYLLMRFKQAVVRDFGLQEGFEVYRRTVTRHRLACLRERRLASQLTFAATRGDPFIELRPAGETFTLAPPRVIGPGNHRQLVGRARAFYLACVRDVRVRGRSETIVVEDTALLDFQEPELSRIDDEIEFDPAVFHRARAVVLDIASDSDADALRIDDAFTLLGAHSDFFGHWMWEYLPRLVAALMSGILSSMPVLIDAGMPKTHRQALELMLAGSLPIVEIPPFASVLVERLWFAPNLFYMPLHERRSEDFTWDHMVPPPVRFAPIIDEMSRRADRALGTACGPQRVFLARKDFRHRKLVNRAAIEGIATQHGFVVVYPEDLDFGEQVRLLRSARFVVAPEGSALFLGFFAKPGLRLCILNHTATEALAIYNGLLSAKQVDITVLTGPVVKKHYELAQYSDYCIDELSFHRFLGSWLVGGGQCQGL